MVSGRYIILFLYIKWLPDGKVYITQKTGAIVHSSPVIDYPDFFIWPAFMALVQSVYFSDAFGLKQQFAGLSNFVDLFMDPEFSRAILITLIIAFSTAAATMGFGLLLAYLVFKRKKASGFTKHCYCGLMQ